MSTPTPGKTWIDSAPPLEPYRYGLFSVMSSLTNGQGQWQVRGIEYLTDGCAQGGFVRGFCPTPVGTDGATTHDKPLAEGLFLAEGADPFTVYARAECNAIGFDDPQGLARRRLELIEEREVEHAFAQDVLGADDPRYPLGAGGAAVGLKQAIGALEADAALFYGGAPTLHAPRWTNPYFEDRHLLRPNADTGNLRRTHLDSRVAFGGGYYDNPFDPAAPPAGGTFWLVATGTVRGWRTEPFINETFTTETNLRMAMAERTYALDADCYRAAVLVSVEGEG